MLYVYAEIITIDGNAGTATDYADAMRKLTAAWKETGAWACAVAAGDADEPMRIVLTINADGVFTHGADLPV